ncbi:unnamed protein product [Lathyrus sativus]|nr:unnamed protein product [Lathyrus sativus]
MSNNNGYKSKQRSSTASGYICRIQVLVMSFTLMLMLVILFLVFNNVHDNDNHGVKVKVKPSLAYDSHKQKWNSFDSLVKLDPTREFRNGTDLIWQVPESPKSFLFLAHGCNGKAINFWDKSSECPDCVGLPEGRLLVPHGLAEGFVVITISSARRCWSYGNNEVLIVKDILEWWIGERKLEKLPLVALGASSGGYFVSLLATVKKFNSIVLMIVERMFEEIDIDERLVPHVQEELNLAFAYYEMTSVHSDRIFKLFKSHLS